MKEAEIPSWASGITSLEGASSLPNGGNPAPPRLVDRGFYLVYLAVHRASSNDR